MTENLTVYRGLGGGILHEMPYLTGDDNEPETARRLDPEYHGG